MKVLLIGASGTIGKKVNAALEKRHTILSVGKSSGQFQVDIANPDSIKSLFQEVGRIDALCCITGEAKWAPFTELSEDDFYIGIRSKMMGQVNLVRYGLDYLNPHGSITLTTGILADDPVYMTTSAAMVNGAIHSFVKAMALELTDNHRINVVSSGLVEDAVEKYREFFPGHDPIPMDKVVNGYLRSIEGKGNGEIIRIYHA